MKRVLSGTVAGTMLLCSAALFAESEGVSMDELRECREYGDNEKRLACYDNIGEPAPVVETPAVIAEPASIADTPAVAAVPTPVAETPTVTSESAPQDTPNTVAQAPQETDDDSKYRELTDDVGLPKSEDDYETILATVVRCSVANNRKFYFYFDNGQVWQYLGNKKLRYRNCNTQARLIEDGIGFKLQLDGQSGQLRVKRVK